MAKLTSYRSAGTIVQMRFDYAVTIVTDTDRRIRIQGLFRLTRRHDADMVIDPEDLRGKGYADSLLETLNKTIEDISYTPDGVLRLNISGGFTITVEPDQDYESWTISGPGTALVVCKIGGGVAVWPDTYKTPDSTPSD